MGISHLKALPPRKYLVHVVKNTTFGRVDKKAAGDLKVLKFVKSQKIDKRILPGNICAILDLEAGVEMVPHIGSWQFKHRIKSITWLPKPIEFVGRQSSGAIDFTSMDTTTFKGVEVIGSYFDHMYLSTPMYFYYQGFSATTEQTTRVLVWNNSL